MLFSHCAHFHLSLLTEFTGICCVRFPLPATIKLPSLMCSPSQRIWHMNLLLLSSETISVKFNSLLAFTLIKRGFTLYPLLLLEHSNGLQKNCEAILLVATYISTSEEDLHSFVFTECAVSSNLAEISFQCHAVGPQVLSHGQETCSRKRPSTF